MDRGRLLRQLRALAEPTRLDLVARLAGGERGGTELLGLTGLSQPNLSRHVKVLREAGLLEERRSGRNVYYCLVPNTVADVMLHHSKLEGAPGDASTPGHAGSASWNLQTTANGRDQHIRHKETVQGKAVESSLPEPLERPEMEDWLL